MNTTEKEVTYNATNTYSTINNLQSTTKTVWLVFHGIGYLSRYFIRFFDGLNKEENYIIAPQAPSKYYKDNSYKRVGSSWLTKENTQSDTENVLRYIDALIASEKIPEGTKLVVLGYSQGVSIASRWIASRKIHCDALVIISGGFPKELSKEDFTFMSQDTKVSHILGEKDPYFEIDKVENQIRRLQEILPQIKFITHTGGHELDPKTLIDVL
ncbi:alpha/beta hydrolase [Aquimarina aquimarini]|uniref:alpha/beta hydrolase n=1 Tax=Aquimarina aquimarini TaxID=1191734 RepID=UPI000D552639|nr:esterase [Aquimarina aquimarini]